MTEKRREVLKSSKYQILQYFIRREKTNLTPLKFRSYYYRINIEANINIYGLVRVIYAFTYWSI